MERSEIQETQGDKLDAYDLIIDPIYRVSKSIETKNLYARPGRMIMVNGYSGDMVHGYSVIKGVFIWCVVPPSLKVFDWTSRYQFACQYQDSPGLYEDLVMKNIKSLSRDLERALFNAPAFIEKHYSNLEKQQYLYKAITSKGQIVTGTGISGTTTITAPLCYGTNITQTSGPWTFKSDGLDNAY